jgi:hypothetical protein
MMWYAVGCGPDYVLEDVWQPILHHKERDWCSILGRDVDLYLDMCGRLSIPTIPAHNISPGVLTRFCNTR